MLCQHLLVKLHATLSKVTSYIAFLWMGMVVKEITMIILARELKLSQGQ